MQLHLHCTCTWLARALAHAHAHAQHYNIEQRSTCRIVAKGNMPPRVQSTCTTNNPRWWTPCTIHQTPARPNNRRCDERPVREHHEKQRTWMGPGELQNCRTCSPAARAIESHRTCISGNISGNNVRVHRQLGLVIWAITSRNDERDLPRRHLFVLRLQ
jgi:hypothetical protein